MTTIEPIYASLGATIRALRRSRGMTQQQIADRLGFYRFSSISDLENGKIRLHIHHLILLAEIFDVSPQALFSGSIEESQRETMEIKDEPWREY